MKTDFIGLDGVDQFVSICTPEVRNNDDTKSTILVMSIKIGDCGLDLELTESQLSLFVSDLQQAMKRK